MIRTIVAIERDGFDINTLTMQFEVPSNNFDLISAVKHAAEDYCKTEEGRQTYDDNCYNFNWADFAMYVPSSFCEKYGFKMLDDVVNDVVVDWDEQLVDIDEEDEEEDEDDY